MKILATFRNALAEKEVKRERERDERLARPTNLSHPKVTSVIRVSATSYGKSRDAPRKNSEINTYTQDLFAHRSNSVWIIREKSAEIRCIKHAKSRPACGTYRETDIHRINFSRLDESQRRCGNISRRRVDAINSRDHCPICKVNKLRTIANGGSCVPPPATTILANSSHSISFADCCAFLELCKSRENQLPVLLRVYEDFGIRDRGQNERVRFAHRVLYNACLYNTSLYYKSSE